MQNIQELIFPDSYKIKKHYCDEGKLTHYTVQIVDAELDPFDVEIFCDGVEINTRDYTHICLESWDIDFLGKAYSEFYKEWISNDR